MKSISALYWPKSIIQGVGCSETIVTYCKAFNGSRCVFLTDGNLLKMSIAQDMIKQLRDAGYEVDIISDVEENPSDRLVENVVAKMSDFRPDFIVCFGGGSAIDLGKAANVVYTHGGTVWDYNVLEGGEDKISDKVLPCVAIPTTAGTGSEVSCASLITDTVKGFKMCLLSPHIVPTVSILDPLVTVSMPSKLTAYTGIDALVHGIESYVSSTVFEPSRGLALRGIELIYRALPKAVKCGDDLEARMDMLVGSACGAMAFNNTLLGAVHGCSHQLSTVSGLPHGLANAMMLLPVMRWNIVGNEEIFTDIFRTIGVNVHGKTSKDVAQEGLRLIEQLVEDLGIPKHLSQIGVTADMLDELVDKAYLDVNMLSNPRKSPECPDRVSKEVIRGFYMEVF